MKKWILVSLAACLVAVATILPAPRAHAQSTTGNQTDNSMNDVTNAIWSGLWSGVNLNFGGFSGTSPSGTGNSNSNQASGKSADGTYAALGDSVAAGVGLPNPVPVPSQFTRCGRTAEAYPYQVAQAVQLSLVHAACSGATAGDLFTVQRAGSPNLPPQLDTAFAGGTPQLITITAGANDAHWVQFISTCYYADCATSSNTRAANGYLTILSGKLYALFSTIWLRSGGHPPEVLITGYYNPASPACASRFSNITSDEVNWISGEVTALNQTIQNAAASYSFVRFVPINFSGHDLCSATPWIQGINDPDPFHPTVTGQHVMAEAVLSALGH